MQPREDGFTLIELLIVVAIIAVIAAIGVPGLLRARQSGNEASAIGSIRAINSAEATYAATCGGGGFAQSLADLGQPPPNGIPFVNQDLVAGLRSGYLFAVEKGAGAQLVMTSTETCNGAAADSQTSFFVHAEPVQAGSTGQRSFASNNTQSMYQKADGSQIANDLSDGLILQ